MKPSSARPVPMNLTVSATVGGGMICRSIPAALYQPLSRATIHGIQKPSATGHSWTIRIFVSFWLWGAAALLAAKASSATARIVSAPRRAFMSFLLRMRVRWRGVERVRQGVASCSAPATSRKPAMPIAESSRMAAKTPAVFSREFCSSK